MSHGCVWCDPPGPEGPENHPSRALFRRLEHRKSSLLHHVHPWMCLFWSIMQLQCDEILCFFIIIYHGNKHNRWSGQPSSASSPPELRHTVRCEPQRISVINHNLRPVSFLCRSNPHYILSSIIISQVFFSHSLTWSCVHVEGFLFAKLDFHQMIFRKTKIALFLFLVCLSSTKPSFSHLPHSLWFPPTLLQLKGILYVRKKRASGHCKELYVGRSAFLCLEVLPWHSNSMVHFLAWRGSRQLGRDGSPLDLICVVAPRCMSNVARDAMREVHLGVKRTGVKDSKNEEREKENGKRREDQEMLVQLKQMGRVNYILLHGDKLFSEGQERCSAWRVEQVGTLETSG